MNSPKATGPFTFDGVKLLFAHVERVSVDELRYLLARGSGHVVKGGQKLDFHFPEISIRN